MHKRTYGLIKIAIKLTGNSFALVIYRLNFRHCLTLSVLMYEYVVLVDSYLISSLLSLS